MPINLYGINDNFDPENSHVIPGLMQRFHNAKINNDNEVMVWGTGNAMREFLFVDDMAEASLFVLGIDKEIYDENTLPMISHINVGSGKDITIKELAEIMKEAVGFEGKISFDNTKPDGSPRKLIDVSRLSKWVGNSTSLREGLEHTYNWYKNNLDNAYAYKKTFLSTYSKSAKTFLCATSSCSIDGNFRNSWCCIDNSVYDPSWEYESTSGEYIYCSNLSG